MPWPADAVQQLTAASDFEQTRACCHSTEEAWTWQGHAKVQMELIVSSAGARGNNVAFSSLPLREDRASLESSFKNKKNNRLGYTFPYDHKFFDL